MKYFITLFLATFLFIGCQMSEPVPPKSTSGVKKKSVKVKTQADGFTVEQSNIRDRLKEDSKPGSIKHLYIISPYSGQVLLYSTVKGKVTSSGKRLSPYEVSAIDGELVDSQFRGFSIDFNGKKRNTGEVLQDDGTYGGSNPYIYWWDSKGIYHQHFFTGGQIIHISNQPITTKNIVLNLESSK